MDEWKDAWLDGWINNDMNKKTHLGTPNVEWIFHGIFREMFYEMDEMLRNWRNVCMEVGMDGMLQTSWTAYGSW